MKKRNQTVWIPWLFLLLGALALVLRMGLYAGAEDDRALLVPGHPLEICLWIAAAAAVLGAAVLSRRGNPGVPTGKRGALGSGILIAGVILTLLDSREMLPAGALGILYCIVSGAAVGALGYQAGKLLAGKEPFFGTYAMLCLYFSVQMVVAYQGWSEHPQLQDYVFGLFALLCGALLAYYRGAQLVKLPGKNRSALLGLLGIFCAMAALYRGHFPWLYAAEAVWMTVECMGEPA